MSGEWLQALIDSFYSNEHFLSFFGRFDLIYLMLDPQDQQFDRRLAVHLVELYYEKPPENENIFMDMSYLKDYIAYAKHFIQPKLSKEAAKYLIDSYVEMRRVGSGKGLITAYPRQLESLIRLSEAHARVRLSHTVEIMDVEEARRIHREAIKQSATDPASGKIDISILTTGLSSSNRKRKAELAQALRRLLSTMGEESQSDHQQFSFQDVYSQLKLGSNVMITKEMFEDALRDLQDDNFLMLYGNKFIRLVN